MALSSRTPPTSGPEPHIKPDSSAIDVYQGQVFIGGGLAAVSQTKRPGIPTGTRCLSDPAPAQALLARRKANGHGGMEALRILKRRLSDVVSRAMLNTKTCHIK